MCNLGWCYERGHGVPQDWKQAVEWYRRAAQAGNTVAMGNLGWCYEKGKGVEKDPEAAVSWYRQGAERGSVRSMYELGRCCQGGIGVAEDLKQALIWFHKSAEVGDADSLGLLGWSYEYGIGTEQDYARAVEYYRCAAEKGNASSMNNLAERRGGNGKGRAPKFRTGHVLVSACRRRQGVSVRSITWAGMQNRRAASQRRWTATDRPSSPGMRLPCGHWGVFMRSELE